MKKGWDAIRRLQSPKEGVVCFAQMVRAKVDSALSYHSSFSFGYTHLSFTVRPLLSEAHGAAMHQRRATAAAGLKATDQHALWEVTIKFHEKEILAKENHLSCPDLGKFVFDCTNWTITVDPRLKATEVLIRACTELGFVTKGWAGHENDLQTLCHPLPGTSAGELPNSSMPLSLFLFLSLSLSLSFSLFLSLSLSLSLFFSI
jgi:hypothetical protein